MDYKKLSRICDDSLSNQVTIFKSDDYPDMDGYRDFLEANGLTEEEKSYDSYIANFAEDNWNDFVGILLHADDLAYEANRQGKFVVLGSVGRWDGQKVTYPAYFESLYDAMEYCMQILDDASVSFSDGKLIVSGYHHDGSNKFTILMANEAGSDAIYNDEDEDIDWTSGEYTEPMQLEWFEM